MKRILVLAFGAGIIASPPLAAHDRHWHPAWHGQHHGHRHGSPQPRYFIAVRPVPIPPPVRYYPAPRYRSRGDYCPPRGYGYSSLPLIAGGIIGGVVGNEAGYGNPTAIIGGSVLGSVIGQELGRR